MNPTYTYDPTSHCGSVSLRNHRGARAHDLNDDFIAFVLPDGELAGVEVLDTRPFGDPFDAAAAERAVTWALEQLAARAASA